MKAQRWILMAAALLGLAAADAHGGQARPPWSLGQGSVASMAAADTTFQVAWSSYPAAGMLQGVPRGQDWFRGASAVASYGLVYGFATSIGTRRGMTDRFRVVRLESAYAYDLLGHVFVVKELGTLLGAVTQWSGVAPRRARRMGAWWGAFGSELYMETLNGFMPGVRFDPLDPIANFVGAWIADRGPDLARRHPVLKRLSLQFGYKSWGRALGRKRNDALLGNLWHDLPNTRMGVGFDVGPQDRPWVTLFGTYDITSFELEELENRFGVALELRPFSLMAPWLEHIPVANAVLAAQRWLDDRMMMPGLTLQLFHVGVGPFSDRAPFAE